MARLVDALDSACIGSDVVGWASPVPFFGRIRESTVATVGINPSDREFLRPDGTELDGHQRRLPTLASLSLENWSEASGDDIRTVVRACMEYFERNPYRRWFDVLERMLNVGGFSYYSGEFAAHLDLVAYATSTKWGALPSAVRRELVARGRQTLAEVIRDSGVEVLVLNGQSVVKEFVISAQLDLSATAVPAWTLPRAAGVGVRGVRYSGTLTSMGGIELERRVAVIGFNHNLQSSFGVTNAVLRSIAEEVGEAVARTHERGPR